MLSKILESYDLVVGSRYCKGGGIENWSFYRRLISHGATLLAKLLLPSARVISDPLSGFFMVKREVLENIDFHIASYKALLVILSRGKFKKVCEVPYLFRRREKGRSKLGIKEMLSYLSLLLRLSKWRPIKFGTVGLSGVFVNEGLLYLLIKNNIPPELAVIFSIETSILSNFLLNDIWTFKERRKTSFLGRLLRYHSAVAFGGFLNFIVFLILVWIGWNIFLSNFIGILVGFIANYIFSEFKVWR